MNIARQTPKMETFAKNPVKTAELKLLAFIHEHNLPFLLMDHLPKLVAFACPDSSIAKQMRITKTKATQITTNQITIDSLLQLKERLNINKLYSLIIHETTDVSTEKILVV